MYLYMKGLDVKKKLQNNGFSLKTVADLMSETPQNLNSMLNAQDIKTGVIERIAEAIKKPLYFFYQEKVGLMDNDVIVSAPAVKITRKQQVPPSLPVATPALSEREALMKEQLAQKDKEIRALNREVGALQYENGALQKKADALQNELEVCKKNLSELQVEALAMRTNNTMGVNLYEQPSQYPPLLNAAEPQEQYGAKIGKVRAP
jgi:DNA-binding transcriptional MerR regulator